MSNLKKIKFLFVVLAVFCFSCTAPAPQKSRNVSAAYPPIVASLPMYVAESQALFQNGNVSISKAGFVNSNDMINAMVARQVDVLPAVSLIPIINLEIEYPGRVRLFSHSRMRAENAFDNLIVKSASPVQQLKDLENKKIGVFPGTSATKMLTVFLKNKGVDTQGINFVQLPPPTQISSLESGAIDALFTYEPVTTIALKSEKYRKLFGSVYADLLSPCPIGASVISREFERNNPELAADVIKVIDRGVQFIRDNPAQAKTLLPQHTEIAPEIAKEVNFVDVTLSNENDNEILQKFINLLYETGEIKEKIDARRLTDPTK
jgi:ABC-type nitrate/sulfonate/bicarbonate transport system substrate-binding protein